MSIISYLSNAVRRTITSWLRRRGYSPYAARSLSRELVDDFRSQKSTPLSKKLWAYRRGFFAEHIAYYGLTEENYRDYLSDFDYLHLHPVNGSFSMWIDDKLSMRYILQPFALHLPEYYYHLCRGEILRLMDCPEGFGTSIQDLLRLLETKGALAAKRKAGSLGKGFHKLGCDGQDFFIDNQPSTRAKVEELIRTWLKSEKEEHLVTEYLQQHRGLQKYYPDAPASLRIMVIRERGLAARIAYGWISIPTSRTGILTNQPEGWAACMVDIRTGEMFKGKTTRDGEIVPCDCHPDSGVPLKGVLPNWDLILEKIPEICSYVPQLRYMGFDIIITGEGFKIIEINSHPYIPYLQLEHPLLKDEETRGFFVALLEEKGIKRDMTSSARKR